MRDAMQHALVNVLWCKHVQSGNAFIFCSSCGMGVLAPTGETTQRQVDRNLCKSKCVRKEEENAFRRGRAKNIYTLPDMENIWYCCCCGSFPTIRLIGVFIYYGRGHEGKQVFRKVGGKQ